MLGVIVLNRRKRALGTASVLATAPKVPRLLPSTSVDSEQEQPAVLPSSFSVLSKIISLETQTPPISPSL